MQIAWVQLKEKEKNTHTHHTHKTSRQLYGCEWKTAAKAIRDIDVDVNI